MKLISTFFGCFVVFLLCSCSSEEVVETDSLYPNIQYLVSTDSKLIEDIYQIDQRNIKNKEVVSIEMEVLVKKGYAENVRDLKLIVENSPNLLSSNSGGFLNPPFTSSNNVKAIYNVLLEGTETDAKSFIKDWEFKLKWEDEEGTHEIKLNNKEFKVKQP